MAIEARNLSFSYPGRDVLKDVSFRVEDGEFLAITGATGSGKTTLAYTFNGIIPHEIGGRFSGSVTVGGMDTRKHKIHEMARKVGFVFQDPDWQIFSLTLRDEVSFGLRNLGFGDVDRRVKEALSQVGLQGHEEAVPHRLSHGQKQKLCIASVLAMEPDIIVLDEPTSQLDHRSKINVYETLRKLNRQGKTVVVIEHDTELLKKYATSMLLIDDGMVAAFGKTTDVLRKKKLLEKLGIKIPGRCI